MPDLLGAAAGGAEHPDPEVERLARPLGVRVQEREHVDLRVPEVVALVAVAGHALGGHAVTLAAGGRLQQLEEVEADGLLELGRALELHVAAAPEVGDAPGMGQLDALVAGAAGAVQRPVGAPQQLARGRLGAPVVGDVLAQPQRPAGGEVGAHGNPGAVAERALSTETGEEASMSCSIPHASSSPLLRRPRGAGGRGARPSARRSARAPSRRSPCRGADRRCPRRRRG